MNTTSHPQITIPKPCHEDWNKMTPDQRGAFCSVCSKSVWDFTAKTPDEIANILMQESGKKMCGRFRTDQLAQPLSIDVPLHVLHEPRLPRLARFIAVALVIFGSSLFNVAFAQGGISVNVVQPPTRIGEVTFDFSSQEKRDTVPVPIKCDPPAIDTLEEFYLTGDIVITHTRSFEETDTPAVNAPLIPEAQEPATDTAVVQHDPFITNFQDRILTTVGLIAIEIKEPRKMKKQRRRAEKQMQQATPEQELPLLTETTVHTANSMHEEAQPTDAQKEAPGEKEPLPANGIFSVSPNPTDGTLILSYSIPEQTGVTIEIIDMQGKALLRLAESERHEKGDFHRMFDVSALPPGAYLCVLQSAEGAQTLKFVKE